VLTRITAAVIAGLVIGETAGQSVTLHFDLDGDPFTVSDTIYAGDANTWTVYASFTGYDDPSAYFGGFVGRFDPSAAGIGAVSNLTNLMANAGVEPVADGGGVTAINIFHSVLLGTDDPSNPLPIFAFEFTPSEDALDGDGETLSYTASGLASVFASNAILLLDDQYTDLNLISDRVFIPGQAAIAVLLGGMGLAHRRRTIKSPF